MERPTLYHAAATVLIIGAVLVGLYFGRGILLPLLFAGLFALLLHPVDRWVRTRTGLHWLGVGAASVVLILVFSGIIGALTWQIGTVADDTQTIKSQLQSTEGTARDFVTQRLGFSNQQIENVLQKVVDQTGSAASGFLGNLTGILGNLFLTLVYFILFLFQKDRFKEFFYRIYPNHHQPSGEYLLEQTNKIARRYLVGKVIVILILSGLYYVGFLIIGLRFALLVALLAGIASIVPYLGNLIGGGIGILVAIVFGDLNQAFWVIAVITIAQILESYILTPLIIGDEVGLNPWATVLSVVVFGMFWGVGGAIIALPLMGIVNEFFKAHEPTRHLGFLLGQDEISRRD